MDFNSFDYKEAEDALAWVCDISRQGYFVWFLDDGSDSLWLGYSKNSVSRSVVVEKFADYVGLPAEAVSIRVSDEGFPVVRGDGKLVAVSVPDR